ncbi:serine/threonine protein kinase [Scardovia inopinata]|uniref:non-specific serine/threonine protein kinase n=1 Tax=Scardovia inopinata F0304 TaxID=641146 RepID=W5IJP8_SCAIO|nr:Stk1 family PASTA domain-containing Ser/Thr kinase [Scardovia inopinata]EFG27218.2 hypothetical protein HMPREF9020_00857 [Scardovia inopinata F0304]BAR06829.1 putative serine-threonine protein kinase [Scardovia inopinata JCM 12537]SUV50890.1 serine/threonine protein kinase [Scardovia inopinata]
MNEITGMADNTVIDGRYRIVRRIADGGMATVYQAVDNRLNRTVALKIMHAQLAQGPHAEEYIQRFQREAQSAASVSNSHIVPVYDTGTFQNRSYLVMELIDGVTLRQKIQENGTFSIGWSLEILSQVLDGLAAAHAHQVIHRDIKPENIMISRQGIVKITDFGLAKATSQETLSSTGMLLGTASYLAPETIENNYSSPQSDLYAVGIMGWEMIMGTVPFVSSNPVTVVFKHVHDDVPPLDKVNPSVPRQFSSFIAHLTERDPAHRPANGQEALTALKDMRASLTADEINLRIRPSDYQSRITKPVKQTSKQTDGFSSMGARSHSPEAAANYSVPQSLSDPTAIVHVKKTISADRIAATSQVTAEKTEKRRSASKKKRFSGRLRISGALVLVLALAALILWWFLSGPGSYYTLPLSQDATCTNNAESSSQTCSIVGSKFSDYRTILNDSGIPYTVAYQYSDTVAKGKIISGTPHTVGDHISKRHGTVHLVVSRGVHMITIPADIINPHSKNGKNPIKTLKSLGFDSISHNLSDDQYSATVPKGGLIYINPSAGKRISHNTRIRLILSLGPKPVAMPDIVGEEWAKAKAMLAEARLKVTVVQVYSSTVKKGVVIKASLKAGAQIHWNDTVTVTLSKGPETLTVPDVVGMDVDKAKSLLKSKGFTVKEKNTLGLGTTVIDQSLKAGSRVKAADDNGNPPTIVLTVSLFSW